jgi:SAM-dependent methyltransferase
MANYIDTTYGQSVKPKTNYPHELSAYLFKRFKMEPGQTIIDVGSGRGDYLKEFKVLGLKAIGLDHGRSEIENLDLDIRKVDFEKDKFPLPDSSVDIIFCKSVVEHLQSPENLMREARRVLKSGGIFIIMTPDWQSQMHIFYYNYTHVQPYVAAGVAGLLELFDFTEIEAELFYQLPLVWRAPWLKILLKPLRWLWPVKRINKSNFFRWSRELMILGKGVKGSGRERNI